MKYKVKLTKIFGLVFLVFAAGILMSCTKKETQTLNSAKKIRYIGYVTYYPIFIADRQGFFKEEFGDSVEFEFNHRMNGGAAAMEAMAGGEIDFAALGDMPIVQARANGLDVRVISSLFTSTTGYGLVAAKDSGIHFVQDLRGKKVAVMGASVQNKLLLKYLEKENIPADSVDILYMKSRDQLAAFVANSLDAAVTAVPYTQNIIEKTGAYQVLDATGYDTIHTYIAANGKFLDENPDFATKFLRAVKKANKWIESHYSETMESAAAEEGNKVEYEDLYYKTREFTFNLSDETLDSLQDTVNYLYNQGTISEKLDARSFADTRFIKAAE